MIFLTLGSCSYELKFGIKSLNLLSNFLQSNDGDIGTVLSLSLQHLDLSDIQRQEICHDAFLQYRKFELHKLLIAAYNESLDGLADIDNKEYQKLYQLAVGEIGLSPESFQKMTLAELNLAYKGYIERQQFQANCILLALCQAKKQPCSKISLLSDDGIDTTTLEQRKDTFHTLGIKD